MNKLLKFFLIFAFLSGFLAVVIMAGGIRWGTMECGMMVFFGGVISMMIAGVITFNP